MTELGLQLFPLLHSSEDEGQLDETGPRSTL